MKYALDTNAVVHYFRRRGRVGERLKSMAAPDVVISSVVAYELAVGVAKSPDPVRHRAQLDAFVGIIKVLPFDLADAESAATVRADLERRGAPIGPYDVQIAGMALARGLILVTRNTSEFVRVPGLRIENWYD